MDNIVFTLLEEIKKNNPNLVQRLLDKWERDGQTIYGDLNDYMKDMYSNIDTSTRDEIVKHLIADYVIKHPYCLQKVYIVQQESNVDGEIIINSTPCATMEVALKVLKRNIEYILNGSYHFGGRTKEELEEYFEIEQTPYSYYINDPSDDYYEDIKIIEKTINVM